MNLKPKKSKVLLEKKDAKRSQRMQQKSMEWNVKPEMKLRQEMEVQQGMDLQIFYPTTMTTSKITQLRFR